MALEKKAAAKKKIVRKKPTGKKPARKKVIKKPAGKKVVKEKISKKKPSVKRPAKKIILKAKVEGILIGKVTHYFPHVQAAVVKLKAPISVGDIIKLKGHTTDFTETVNSIQMDRAPISQGKKGQEIGLLVKSRARQGDLVYKI